MADSSVVFNIIAKDKASVAFKQIGTNVENLSSHLSHVGSTMSSFLGNLMSNAVSTLAGSAINAGKSIIELGIKAAAANQTAKVSFDQLLGSGEKAAKFLNDLKKFAAETPFELPDLQTAASRLLAVGVKAKDVIPLMTRLGDATAGMGTGADGINRAVYALQQMKQAGKVSLEDINQLTDAGIPALDALASHFHTTVANIRNMITKGKIKASDVFSAIEGGEGPAFSRLKDMMKKQSATLEGLWSTLKDNITQKLADAFTPLIPTLSKIVDWLGKNAPKAIDAVVRTIKQLAGFLNSSGIIDWFKEFAAKLKFGDSFKDIKNDAMNVVKTIKENWPTLKPVVEAVGGTILTLIKAFITLEDWLIKLDAIWVKAFSGLVITVNKAIAGIVKTFGVFIDAAAKAFGWIPGLGPKLRKAASDFDKFRDKILSGLNAINGKTVTFTIFGKVAGASLPYANKPMPHASGGIATGFSLLGEKGPELVDFGSSRARVSTAQETRRILSGGGSGSGTIHFAGNVDSAFATAFKALLRSGAVQLFDGNGRRISWA